MGGIIASFGFFFLPLLELKPNRLASGIPFELLQLGGDTRYIILFLLTFIVLAVALNRTTETRGWTLVALGNTMMFLTLFLGALAGANLIGNAETLLEGVNLRNPRILPSAGLILGLVGGYVTLFGGLSDLRKAKTPRVALIVAAWSGLALILIFLLTGQFDIYSVMVEFRARGELLGNRIVEHIMFVGVALIIGFVLGVGLGLWSFRDERMAPIILYVVGIIQTIPSLALFGVLLVPLARLGDRSASSIFLFLLVTAVIAALAIFLYRRFVQSFGPRLRQAFLIVTALLSAVPLALFVVLLSSFVFRSSFVVFTADGTVFASFRTLLSAMLLVSIALWLISRYLKKGLLKRIMRYGGLGGLALFGLTLLLAVGIGSSQFLSRVDSFAALTVRDLGVSGIGTAPAVIALTLYSLLPMVRNTYAGLVNVDPAITDAGRGMGMTPSQRFFQIELPIAFPVIMAGVRNAAVSLVGIGAIASVIGAGGLGDFILSGIDNASIDQILLGAIPAVILATLLDAGLRGLEQIFTSPGIKQV
ncbi:MAG: ABC transporter permease subunit [Trueperaceae bacterium]|nr:ABC transporter permease subunit [Trueperaceae bacterium]